MRADRLIAALMVLQTKGQITAAELARELEVSERTARRDLESLAMSGVPIYSQPGRGGGWRLIGGASTDLTGLSADEARHLFLALGRLAEPTAELQGALRKLVVALPEGFRTDALAAADAIRVDPVGWGQLAPAATPDFVDELSRAVISGRQAKIDYQRPQDTTSAPRTVHPLGLVTKRGVWYLVANTDRGIRTYRVSRIRSVREIDAAVERPADFDLDATWRGIVDAVETHRTGIEALALVSPDLIGPLRWLFAQRCDVIGENADGWFEVRLRENSAAALGAQVAGFGSRLRFVEPDDELRHEMVRIAAELIALYPGEPTPGRQAERSDAGDRPD